MLHRLSANKRSLKRPHWDLSNALSPPSGILRSYTLVSNSWLHLNSASFPVIASLAVPHNPHSALRVFLPCRFHRSLINSTRKSNIYHLQFVCPLPASGCIQLPLKKHKKKKKTDTVNPHKKFNTLREGINGPNFDILNRERCDDTGF